MKKEAISQVINQIDDRYIAEAIFSARNSHHLSIRKTTAILLAACLILSFSALAFGSGSFRKILGWGNNFSITQYSDASDESESIAVLDTDNLTDPVIIKDGKLIFIVNEEQIDITEQVSETEAFSYEYTDKDGYSHLWLVGLLSKEIEHYGYAEYIRDPEGEWLGGYSARININADGSTEAQWLEISKQRMNIPW